MTDSGKQRPRRAFSTDDAQPDGVDDTRSGHAGQARRGAADDIDAPFTRPGPSYHETAVPAPVLPGTERRAMPGAGAGRRGMRWDGLNDETTPAARASDPETATHAAVSPTPPPRVEPHRRVQQPVPAWSGWPDQPEQQPPPSPRNPYQRPRPPAPAAHRSPARAAEPEPEQPEREAGVSRQDDDTWRDRDEKTASSTSWITHHRRVLTTWVVAAVATAVLVAGGIYVFSRVFSPSPANNANPSTSETTSAAVNLTDTTLLDTSDAGLIDSAASWSVTQTITEKGKETLRKVTCMGSDPTEINTTATLQRALGTQQEDQLALVHQVDAYANEETAQKIYTQRATSLASCSGTPALITTSATVTGLGDDVMQVNVVQDQEDTTKHHTVLLVRTGKVVSLLDVARNASAVDAKNAVDAVQRPLGATCETAAGTCPASPTVEAAAPPAANPQGWLIPHDIPIIAPGHLAWSGSSLKDVDSPGMGCEGEILTSEQGPTDRKQRSYTVSSSDAAFKAFGITQYRFAFADETAATAFGDLLSESLASCPTKSAATKVTELEPVTTDGSAGPAVTARLFTITQQVSDSEHKSYQLVVARSGASVGYLLFNGVGDTQFTEEQLSNLAIRLGQRTAQG